MARMVRIQVALDEAEAATVVSALLHAIEDGASVLQRMPSQLTDGLPHLARAMALMVQIHGAVIAEAEALNNGGGQTIKPKRGRPRKAAPVVPTPEAPGLQ